MLGWMQISKLNYDSKYVHGACLDIRNTIWFSFFPELWSTLYIMILRHDFSKMSIYFLGIFDNCVLMILQWFEELLPQSLELVLAYIYILCLFTRYIYTLWHKYKYSFAAFIILQEFAKVVELEFVKTDLIPTFTNLSSDEQVLLCISLLSLIDKFVNIWRGKWNRLIHS